MLGRLMPGRRSAPLPILPRCVAPRLSGLCVFPWPSITPCPLSPISKVLLARAPLYPMSLNEVVPSSFAQMTMFSIQMTSLRVCWGAQHPADKVRARGFSPRRRDEDSSVQNLPRWPAHGHQVPTIVSSHAGVRLARKPLCPCRGSLGVRWVVFRSLRPPVGDPSRESQLHRLHLPQFLERPMSLRTTRCMERSTE